MPSCKGSAVCSSTFLQCRLQLDLCCLQTHGYLWHLALQVLRDRLPFDEVALLQENSEFITRCGPCPTGIVDGWHPECFRLGQLILYAVPAGCPTVPGNSRSCSPACPVTPVVRRALGIGNLAVHAISYEQQQTAENAQIAGATPGNPATLFDFA